MNGQSPVHIFEYGTVARGIRYGEVQGSHSRTVRHHAGDHLEPSALHLRHRLVHGRTGIEYVLYPCCDGKAGRGTVPLRIGRFGEPQQIRHESRLIHAVGTAYIVCRSHHAAVPGGPRQGVAPHFAAALHTAREYPQIAPAVLLPVHGTGRQYGSVGPHINHSRTRFRPLRESDGQRPCEERGTQKSAFHTMPVFSVISCSMHISRQKPPPNPPQNRRRHRSTRS